MPFVQKRRHAEDQHVLPAVRPQSLGELPAAAREYVEFVERSLEVPIDLVGVGAARERVLV